MCDASRGTIVFKSFALIVRTLLSLESDAMVEKELWEWMCQERSSLSGQGALASKSATKYGQMLGECRVTPVQ